MSPGPQRRRQDGQDHEPGQPTGVYDGQQSDFAADEAAIEITLANGGRGPCGVPDEFGRCSARYHYH